MHSGSQKETAANRRSPRTILGFVCYENARTRRDVGLLDLRQPTLLLQSHHVAVGEPAAIRPYRRAVQWDTQPVHQLRPWLPPLRPLSPSSPTCQRCRPTSPSTGRHHSTIRKRATAPTVALLTPTLPWSQPPQDERESHHQQQDQGKVHVSDAENPRVETAIEEFGELRRCVEPVGPRQPCRRKQQRRGSRWSPDRRSEPRRGSRRARISTKGGDLRERTGTKNTQRSPGPTRRPRIGRSSRGRQTKREVEPWLPPTIDRTTP